MFGWFKKKKKTITISLTKRTYIEFNADMEVYLKVRYNVFEDNYSGYAFDTEEKALKYYDTLVKYKGDHGVKIETLKSTTIEVEV